MRLYSVKCCNIFQSLYTAGLNSALYLYTGISSIPVGFVWNLLLITVPFYNKKKQLPFFKLVNLLICRSILIPYDEYNSTFFYLYNNYPMFSRSAAKRYSWNVETGKIRRQSVPVSGWR
jgi:hypothetical protein